MKVNGKNVTKEWYNCKLFEDILQDLWTSGEEKWLNGFTRYDLMAEINSGRFGTNILAEKSPKEGSVEEILKSYKSKGVDWLDIQDLTYHYSWQNPNGNYHSHEQMLEYLTGSGKNPKYILRKKAFINKKCFWCESETKLDKTHIIPRVLGGRTWYYIACKKCNNYFGHHVESEVLKNSIFTAALKKLGLKDSQEAYRFAERTDSSTGYPIKFVGDNAEVRPNKVSENHFRANLKDLEKYKNAQIDRLKKIFPEEKIRQIRLNDNTTLYEVGNEKYKLEIHPEKQATINIKGLTKFPSVDLICKIVLEMTSFLDVASEPIFKNFKNQFIEVKQSSSKNEILFAHDELRKLSRSTLYPEYDQIENKEKYDYKPYHVITFWITSNDNLYAELSFFDALTCDLILGKISNDEREIIEKMCLFEYKFGWDAPSFDMQEKNQSNYTDDEKEIIANNSKIIDNIFKSFDN